MKEGKPISRQRIEHILYSIQNIQTFTKGYSLESFENDLKVYYACLHQFAVMGEAVSGLDEVILKKYVYPWYKVKSFRNFIIHEYPAVDAQVVWDTIQLVLPGFKDHVQQILEKEF
jgi:uncharacterized protein with HEPN domain